MSVVVKKDNFNHAVLGCDVDISVLMEISKECAMRFVVIGGDAAGMSAASRARRKVTDLEVTVFEQTQDWYCS